MGPRGTHLEVGPDLLDLLDAHLEHLVGVFVVESVDYEEGATCCYAEPSHGRELHRARGVEEVDLVASFCSGRGGVSFCSQRAPARS